MPQLHETPMGHRFFESTLPRIADALEALVERAEPDSDVIDCASLEAEHEELRRMDDDARAKVSQMLADAGEPVAPAIWEYLLPLLEKHLKKES